MPPHSTDLTTMNISSIKFASWVARVTYADSYSYAYKSKKTGKDVTSYKFECRLVGKSETAYVLAVLKGTQTEVASAKERFKNDSIWEVSKIKFEENTSQPFISSALKVSVDLQKSFLHF